MILFTFVFVVTLCINLKVTNIKQKNTYKYKN